MSSCCEDLRDFRNFWLPVLAELLGTMYLVLVACGSISALSNSPTTTLQIALCFGLSVATIVRCIGRISGGHINPAVSFGFFIARKLSLMSFFFYVSAQCIGATLGALLLRYLTDVTSSRLGSPIPVASLDPGQILGVEIAITFIFVFTVFATCDTPKDGATASGSLAIGLACTMCHLWAVPISGAGMNPARVLGPAIISNTWNFHWIYWVGPLIGGGLAAIMYEHLFAANASLAKSRVFFTKRDYEDSHFEPTGGKKYQLSAINL